MPERTTGFNLYEAGFGFVCSGGVLRQRVWIRGGVQLGQLGVGRVVTCDSELNIYLDPPQTWLHKAIYMPKHQHCNGTMYLHYKYDPITRTVSRSDYAKWKETKKCVENEKRDEKHSEGQKRKI